MHVLSNKVVSYAIGNWGIGWFLQYQSAPVLARPVSVGSTPINNFLGRGPGSAAVEAECGWKLHESVVG